jgi:hypothetical protein
VIWLLIAACGGAPSQATSAGKTPEKAPEAPAKAAMDPAKAPTKAATSTPEKLAETRDDVPLPLGKFLGQPVADVQAQLGEHLGKGMARKSCVRFVPERTFLSCEYALQRYADKTGNFTAIQVAYEDGAASAIAYDGWKHAAGPFDAQALLSAIGLTLPGPGELTTPQPNVKLWRWFNQRARLLIHGKQYRVELSVIDDDWARSRVEVILNDPLTPAQKAKILQPGGQDVREEPPAAPAKAP